MLLSYVGVFMAVTPAVVGTTFFALGAICANAKRDRSDLPPLQLSDLQRYAYSYLCLRRGLWHTFGHTMVSCYRHGLARGKVMKIVVIGGTGLIGSKVVA